MDDSVVTVPLVGSRLRSEREARGLTQEDFGRLGAVTRNSQAAYEAGKRACDVGYLSNLDRHGVDVCFVLTGMRSAEKLSPDVANYAELSPHLGDAQKAALLLLASSVVERGDGRTSRATLPIALPPEEALERGYLGILTASRKMDEAALARELARRLPMLLEVLKGPLTIERNLDDEAEAPSTARPEQRRA